jgi:hypothetical protein
MRDRKMWSWVLEGSKTKNDCVGKDQQQFTQNRSKLLFGIFNWWLATRMEAESAMLEATTKQQLVKTELAEKT